MKHASGVPVFPAINQTLAAPPWPVSKAVGSPINHLVVL